VERLSDPMKKCKRWCMRGTHAKKWQSCTEFICNELAGTKIVRFHLTHRNYLRLIINTLSVIIILTDNTNLIISNKNLYDFCILLNIALFRMNTWFIANTLTLNLYKNKYKYNQIYNISQYPLNIEYNDEYIEESINKSCMVYKLIPA
jgi:hypothetical protein